MSLKFYFTVIFMFLVTQTGYSQNIYNGGDNDGFGSASVGGVGTEKSLPIELVYFDASVQTNEVVLKWQTDKELNNDYFTIEKSNNANDWITVSRIDGAGNSNRILKYSATDPNPFNGISFYRLKQTDFDGNYKYSQIITVIYSPSFGKEVIIYPNPAHQLITIQAHAQELLNLIIYNSVGQDVTNRIRQISKSNDKMVFDISTLPPGIYLVKTTTTVHILYKSQFTSQAF